MTPEMPDPESPQGAVPLLDELLSGPSSFQTGRILATPGALAQIQLHRISLLSLLQRHLRCDWGDVGPEDANANWQALIHDGRLLSSYPLSPEVTIWIITEADRSATTALLPEEY